MQSTKILLDRDLLPGLIGEKGLYPVGKWAEKTIGRGEGIYGTNSVLWEIHKDIPEERWLKEMTIYLFCRTERIRSITKAGAAINEFAYIPAPGLRNGSRIKHPCEAEHRTKLHAILTEAPLTRSRELAWMIPYRTAVRETNLIFILTFDPIHEVIVRTLNKEWEACTAYWRKAAEAQGFMDSGIQTTCIHAFTGLHEWMKIIETGDTEETPQSWSRHKISLGESQLAAAANLDIYYSNSVLAYAWSTLEKQKGRERARTTLQQGLCKKVILFDPIYGRIQGIKTNHVNVPPDFLDPGDTETSRTAKSFWDATAITAHEKGASDIHIEPVQTAGKKGCDLIVSLRKDGQLNFHTRIPGEIAPEFVRFVLETSGIIREETRIPQDGRRGWINPISGEAIDMRISVTPAGAPIQKIVIRLLDTNKLKHGISDLGLEMEELRIWEKALKLNQSLVLVSGPTNSGKTVSGTTPITTKEGRTLMKTLVEGFLRGNPVSVITLEGEQRVTNAYACGEKPEWELKTTRTTVSAATTHPFLSNGKWTPLGEIKQGEKILNGETNQEETVVSVKPTGNILEMFDIEVSQAHHYFANGLVAHNSTTLYAALLSIFERDNRRSFSTIEDPVEYRLPFRSTQSPVMEEKGATYERLIRQAMRNDGDTFLIGEIRDGTTASASIQLALTGHQVLSSIHANSAIETVLRLLELGVDRHLLSEILRLVVAQRLVPTPCPFCIQKIEEPNEIKRLLRKYGGEIRMETCNPKWERKYKTTAHWKEGEGCPSCGFTGIAGMTAAQEFLIIDEKNKKAVKAGDMDALADSMIERSLPTMEETVWRLAWLGRVSMSQAGELTDQLKSG